MKSVGVLHPGAMGVSVAVSLQDSGQRVLWASEDRSQETRARAEQYDLIERESLAELCRQCDLLVSVCPPHAAEQVASAVASEGFAGIYLDANAIAPERSKRLGAGLSESGATYVDGGIIGGPAWQAGKTRLYLSGTAAAEVAQFFQGGALETHVLAGGVGRASALKTAYAAYTKGSTALLAGVVSLASQLGVLGELEAEWEMWGDRAEEMRQRLRRVTAKAWRFEGEMHEIAATFAEAGLPTGFHASAAELYRRLAGFKGRAEPPPLNRVLEALAQENTDR